MRHLEAVGPLPIIAVRRQKNKVFLPMIERMQKKRRKKRKRLKMLGKKKKKKKREQVFFFFFSDSTVRIFFHFTLLQILQRCFPFLPQNRSRWRLTTLCLTGKRPRSHWLLHPSCEATSRSRKTGLLTPPPPPRQPNLPPRDRHAQRHPPGPLCLRTTTWTSQ